jgi:hypothetical protein
MAGRDLFRLASMWALLVRLWQLPAAILCHISGRSEEEIAA